MKNPWLEDAARKASNSEYAVVEIYYVNAKGFKSMKQFKVLIESRNPIHIHAKIAQEVPPEVYLNKTHMSMTFHRNFIEADYQQWKIQLRTDSQQSS